MSGLLVLACLFLAWVNARGGNGWLLTPLYSFDIGSWEPDDSSGDPGTSLVLSGNTLYGTTSGVDPSDADAPPGVNYGTVFKVNADGSGVNSGYYALHTFLHSADGAAPSAGLVLSGDGNTLYGTTTHRGGSPNPVDGLGTVFSQTTDGSGPNGGFQSLYTFGADQLQAAHQGLPLMSLVLEGTTLYGTREQGGDLFAGSVFSFQTAASAPTTLYPFMLSEATGGSGTDGNLPSGRLVPDPTGGGGFYGTTLAGGLNNQGTIFIINGMNETKLYDFTALDSSGKNRDGSQPNGGLLAYLNPNSTAACTLYGTAQFGGQYSFGTGRRGFGTVFKFNTADGSLTTLKSFKGPLSEEGANPLGCLVLIGGRLYGTTASGGYYGNGTVFSISTDGTDFQTIYNFSPTHDSEINSDGAGPVGGLISSGNSLYGSTILGGTSGSGTVFRLTYYPYLQTSDTVQRFPGLFNFAPPPFPLRLILQTALTINGPFTNIIGATSPYTNTFTDPQRFFRLVLDTTTPSAVPDVTTSPASSITSTAATLNGNINPDGAATAAWFEYGLDSNYTGGISGTTLVTASNTDAVAVNGPVSGLTPGTLYHFQLIGANGAVTNYGGDQTFTTPVPPVLTTTPATNVTQTTAVLTGTINGEGSQAIAHFQYGTDTNYTGGQVDTYFTSFNGDTEPFSFTLPGLMRNSPPTIIVPSVSTAVRRASARTPPSPAPGCRCRPRSFLRARIRPPARRCRASPRPSTGARRARRRVPT